MSSVSAISAFRCSRCGREYEALVYRMIDAEAEPSLKESVKDGSLFVRECPSCGCKELILSPVIYRDSHLLLCLSDRPIAVEGLVAGDETSLDGILTLWQSAQPQVF